MSNFLIYILVLLLNVNNLFFQELVKLPVLFQHYSEHKQLDEQIGMLDYLAMHYLGKDHNDNDQKRDADLPFKSIKLQHSITFTYLLPQVSEHLTSDSSIFIEKISDRLKNLISDPHFQTLFKPPLYYRT